MDKGLAAGMRISLRINVDFMNIDTLPELADFLVKRGWTDYE
ncbi:MAG: hypothetical protein ACR2OR_06605 [Hyphomicrobiales bacterium]